MNSLVVCPGENFFVKPLDKYKIMMYNKGTKKKGTDKND